MKRLITMLSMLAVGACATGPAVRTAEGTSSVTPQRCAHLDRCEDEAPSAPVPTTVGEVCGQGCQQRRRAELNRLLNLGAPTPVTVAAASSE